ncbi:hypothetical protein SAMN06295879_0540 [Agreia bicolorata]|uniref:Uncharacterized protein n=1 Tax=Agreia bicolorata TaxID=110935 RepID=A0A1T4WZM3_9MICO|nr:hypothetical protein [Agreia bicolorata]SKA82833.1 hypothetical protein SAMN06295879_0540 [Agreia bicolorata]
MVRMHESKAKTPPSRALTVGGLILSALGVIALLGGAFMVLGAGFQLAPSVPFGETMTVEVSRGDHAVYVTPNDQWGDISCTGDLDGEEIGLRPEMTQQGLLLPERWDAQGSFATAASGVLQITCDGPVPDGRFTVGPVVSFFSIVGAVVFGALAIVLLAVGLALLVLARWRVRAVAQSSAGFPAV